MEARTLNHLPPAAYHDGAVRCLLAIELSKKSWIVAVNTPLSDKISRHTLQACDWKGLLELIERIRTRVSQAFSRPVEVISCYEAGYDGFWLHRLPEAHGVPTDAVSILCDCNGGDAWRGSKGSPSSSISRTTSESVLLRSAEICDARPLPWPCSRMFATASSRQSWTQNALLES
jgi:hypothetical protein